jgi:hypothetical protein
MAKCYIFIISFSALVILHLNAGNLELFKKPPRFHIVDDSGQVILKIKKAEWVYNCIDCHSDFKTRTSPREMVADHRELLYDHIKGEKWCFVCHYESLEKRNRIRLPGGIYRGPTDMVKLCRQCHGEKTNEWEIGIHGKVTGSWLTYGDAKREKRSCNHCHSPHHPRSIKVKPFPGPRVRFERQVNNHE